MKKEAISKLIHSGESETVEFKENFDKETVETVSAFANTKGGTILIGVSDQGKIKGVHTGKSTLRNWSNRISQSIEPKVAVTPDSARIEAKEIALIHVEESRIKPVSYKGRYFKRVGATNCRLSWEDITNMVLESVGATWDELPELRASMEDIDTEKIGHFIKLCNEAGRRPIPEKEKPIDFLQKLKLLKNGHPTRAAILLFGKDPQEFYIPAILKVGRFRPGNIIVDDREIRGTVFDQVEEAMLYFRDRLQTKFEFTGEPQRKVIWEYPLEALRETVINAVCHRDYMKSANTQIKIHDDHILIWNPGKLSSGLTLEQLKIAHPSLPHNRLIAEAFFYAGYIEKWGSGTLKVINECVTNGFPEPEYFEDMGMFGVTFSKDIYTEEYLRNLDLNERQVNAVMYVKEKGVITNSKYQELTGVSQMTAFRDLRFIVKKKVFLMLGKVGRGTKYILNASITS